MLQAYVDGTESFAAVEAAVRLEVRRYATRRAARWPNGAMLVEDLVQVLVTTLWRELDSYDADTTDHSVASWCGSKMEYSMRRFLRAHVRVVDVHVYDDDTVADVYRHDVSFDLVEIVAALRNVRDDGVRAYALAALDTSEEVVARIAADAALVERLGWSDVAMGCRAARKRAVRNEVLRDAIGGA